MSSQWIPIEYPHAHDRIFLEINLFDARVRYPGDMNKIKVYYVPDTGDHDKWTHHVDSIVPKYDVVFSNDDFTLSLYKKREIKTIPVPLLQRETVSGTHIREMISQDKDWSSLVPEGTRNVLLRINARQRLSEIL